MSLFQNLSIHAAIGGLLIGLSALLMMVLLGRITGISGILWQTIHPLVNRLIFNNKTEFDAWRLCFLIGLPIGGALVHWIFQLPTPQFDHTSAFIIILSGLLVGAGTRLGSGCTSGHGICGISRLSVRSLTATGVFMSVAIGIVLLFGAP